MEQQKYNVKILFFCPSSILKSIFLQPFRMRIMKSLFSENLMKSYMKFCLLATSCPLPIHDQKTCSSSCLWQIPICEVHYKS